MSIDSVRYASRTAENASRLACMSLKIPRRIGSVHPRAIGPRPPVFLRAAGTCAFVRLRGQAFEHTPIAAMAEQRKETDDVSGAARAARPAGPGAADLPTDDGPLPGLGDLGDGALGATDGEYGLEPAPEPGPEASAPAPPQVAELAAACVRFVRARYGATLDFEPDTLSFVDHWVREARTELKERPELAELVQSAAGAYLGEVIRREFGAFGPSGACSSPPSSAPSTPSAWRARRCCSKRPKGGTRTSSSTRGRRTRSKAASPRYPRCAATSTTRRARATTSCRSWSTRCAPT